MDSRNTSDFGGSSSVSSSAEVEKGVGYDSRAEGPAYSFSYPKFYCSKESSDLGDGPDFIPLAAIGLFIFYNLSWFFKIPSTGNSRLKDRFLAFDTLESHDDVNSVVDYLEVKKVNNNWDSFSKNWTRHLDKTGMEVKFNLLHCFEDDEIWSKWFSLLYKGFAIDAMERDVEVYKKALRSVETDDYRVNVKRLMYYVVLYSHAKSEKDKSLMKKGIISILDNKCHICEMISLNALPYSLKILHSEKQIIGNESFWKTRLNHRTLNTKVEGVPYLTESVVWTYWSNLHKHKKAEQLSESFDYHPLLNEEHFHVNEIEWKETTVPLMFYLGKTEKFESSYNGQQFKVIKGKDFPTFLEENFKDERDIRMFLNSRYFRSYFTQFRLMPGAWRYLPEPLGLERIIIRVPGIVGNMLGKSLSWLNVCIKSIVRKNSKVYHNKGYALSFREYDWVYKELYSPFQSRSKIDRAIQGFIKEMFALLLRPGYRIFPNFVMSKSSLSQPEVYMYWCLNRHLMYFEPTWLAALMTGKFIVAKGDDRCLFPESYIMRWNDTYSDCIKHMIGVLSLDRRYAAKLDADIKMISDEHREFRDLIYRIFTQLMSGAPEFISPRMPTFPFRFNSQNRGNDRLGLMELKRYVRDWEPQALGKQYEKERNVDCFRFLPRIQQKLDLEELVSSSFNLFALLRKR